MHSICLSLTLTVLSCILIQLIIIDSSMNKLLKLLKAQAVIIIPFGNGAYNCTCPDCGGWLGTNCKPEYSHCPDCGQKLKWSKGSEVDE